MNESENKTAKDLLYESIESIKAKRKDSKSEEELDSSEEINNETDELEDSDDYDREEDDYDENKKEGDFDDEDDDDDEGEDEDEDETDEADSLYSDEGDDNIEDEFSDVEDSETSESVDFNIRIESLDNVIDNRAAKKLFEKIKEKISKVCDSFSIKEYSYEKIILKDYDATIRLKYGQAWQEFGILEKTGDYRSKLNKYDEYRNTSFSSYITKHANKHLLDNNVKKKYLYRLLENFETNNITNKGVFNPIYEKNSQSLYSEEYVFKYLEKNNTYQKYKTMPMFISEQDKYWISVVDCPECGGSGKFRCPDCRGEGKVACGRCNGIGKITCRTCNGTKEIRCRNCKGTGFLKKTGRVSDFSSVPVGADWRAVSNGSGGNDYRWEKEERCTRCGGRGFNKCTNCGPDGLEICPECGGSGLVKCETCGGSGYIKCERCDGTGNLSYIQGYCNVRYFDVKYPTFDNEEIADVFNERNNWEILLSSSIHDVSADADFTIFAIKREIPYVSFELKVKTAKTEKTYLCKCVGNSIERLEGFHLSRDELNLNSLFTYGKDLYNSFTVLKSTPKLKEFASVLLSGGETKKFINYFATSHEKENAEISIKHIYTALSEIAINDISYRHTFISTIMSSKFKSIIDSNRKPFIDAFGLFPSKEFEENAKILRIQSYISLILFLLLCGGIIFVKFYEPWTFPIGIIFLVIILTTHFAKKFAYKNRRDLNLIDDIKKVKILKIAYLSTLLPLKKDNLKKRMEEIFSFISTDKNIVQKGIKYATRNRADRILSKIIHLRESPLKKLYFANLVSMVECKIMDSKTDVQSEILSDFKKRY